MPIKDYSLTPANNTTINSISLAEGCAPSGINDAIRQEMADTRGFYECGGWIDLGLTHTYSSSTAVTVASDVTASYVAGRRIKAVGSGTGTIYGVVASSSYGAPNTTINFTWDSGSLTNEALTVSAGWVVPTGYPINSTAVKGGGDVSGPASSTDGHIPKFSGTGGKTLADGYALDTDTTLAANSDSNVATQKAVKAYVASQVASAGGAVFKNRLINGAMLIDQRNSGAAKTIVAGDAVAYTVDRWYASCTVANVTGQRVAGPTGYQYGYKLTGLVANTSTLFGQRVESFNCADLVSQGVAGSLTVSSTSITTLTWTAYYANSTDNFSAKTQIATGTLTINSTPTVHSFTFNAGASAANGICIEFTTGPLVATQTITYTGVQLEKGSTASSFETLPLDVVLARCYRYYWRGFAGNSKYVSTLLVSAATQAYGGYVSFPAVMRAVPTTSLSAVGDFLLASATVSSAVTSITINSTTLGFGFDAVNATTASLTTNNAALILTKGTGSPYMQSDAEL